MKSVVILMLLAWSLSASAVTKMDYVFASNEQRTQFSRLIKEFRCLVCQNEDLADSNAKLAADLRRQVYTMVRANHNDQHIKSYLVARYGDFVLYKPPLQNNTLLLWFGPLVFLLIGGGVLLFQWYKRR